MNSPIYASSPKVKNQNGAKSGHRNQFSFGKSKNMTPGYGVNSDAFNLDKNIRLVPDRWSDIGWKYINVEPAES